VKKFEFQAPEFRRNKIIEHKYKDSRKGVRDRRIHIIDSDDEIDAILDREADQLGLKDE
jgi:hypothetical protein